MESKRMESVIMYLEYTYYALLLFGILYFAYFVQGRVQGGDYGLYGESLAFGIYIYPGIVLVMSIYGTIKSKKWFVMPIISLIVLLFFFNLINASYGVLLIAYLVISIIGSVLTRLSGKYIRILPKF